MTRRPKTTTTTATTNRLAKREVPPSLPTEHGEQDTDELQDMIAARAYALYEERGYRQGCDLQDWLDAEREILSRQPAV